MACAVAVPLADVCAQETARNLTLGQARELALQHNKDIATDTL